MKTITHTVTHKGWYCFAPVWLTDIEEEGICPLPRHVPGWFLDLAMNIDQGIHWLVTFMGAEEYGFMFWAVQPVPRPFNITISIEG